MSLKKNGVVQCQICKQSKNLIEVVPAGIVREPVAAMIRRQYPEWSSAGFICNDDLNRLRAQYVRSVLEEERGEISSVENQVVKSLQEQELLSKNVNIEFDQKLTFSGKLSDKLSDFVGSWVFIVCFVAVLLLWIALNAYVLMAKPFDPYPFILLNLVLSCLAAIQAPVILMSQNRQEARDRLRSEHDYLVNLKAELEIRHLHEKIDHLLMHQWQKLLEIQQIQTELMAELARNR
jgi:uncharacterized membrane protein